MNSIGVQLAVIGGGVLLLGYFGTRAARGASDAVGQAVGYVGNAMGQAGQFVGQHAATTFNPASPQNAVYGGVNAVGATATGDPNFTLGGWLYDWLNPEPKPYTSGGGGVFNGHGASGGWDNSGVNWFDIPGSEYVMYQTAPGGASGTW